jgi:hypothetical protein
MLQWNHVMMSNKKRGKSGRMLKSSSVKYFDTLEKSEVIFVIWICRWMEFLVCITLQKAFHLISI